MRSKPCSKTNLTILASSKIPGKISLVKISLDKVSLDKVSQAKVSQAKVSRARDNPVKTSQATLGKTALGSSQAKAAKISNKMVKGQTKGSPGSQASLIKAGSQP